MITKSMTRLVVFLLLLPGLHVHAEEAAWQGTYQEAGFVLIAMSDILVPIKISGAALELHHKNLGYYKVSDGTIRAATRLPITLVDQRGLTFSKRPTLFISIRGFDPQLSKNLHYWQTDLQQHLAQLAWSDGDKHSQYVHFSVVWDSHRANQTQVDDLATLVNQFLSERSYPWDVVVLGNSRGGIFAHDFARKIIGNSKLYSLHTVLLDPTQAPLLGDLYPIELASGAPKAHYGSLYYDGQDFLLPPLDTYTRGDMDIEGYNNYGRYNYFFNSGTNHGGFAQAWVNSTDYYGASQLLDDIWQRKQTASFPVEGDVSSRWEVVYLHADPLVVDFSVDYYDGNLSGQFVVNGVTADAGYFSVGTDGVQVSAASVAGSVQAVLQSDSASASLDDGIANTSLEISADSIHIRVNVLNLVSEDLEVDLVDTIFGPIGGTDPFKPSPCPFLCLQ